MELERRFISPAAAQLRIDKPADAPPAIEGYGAVFYRADDPGTEYELWQDVYERILPGAFEGVQDADVRSLFNHDSNWVLGRNRADPPTLHLDVDPLGLRYRVTPPDTQAVRDQVLTPIYRGDVDGSSFMFWPRLVSWTQEVRDGRTIEIREIKQVELIEVGPVTFPAYAATSAGVRAEGQDLAAIRADAAAHRRQRAAQAQIAAEADEWVLVALQLRRRRGR